MEGNLEVGHRNAFNFRRTRGAFSELSRQLAEVTVSNSGSPMMNIQMPSSLASPAPSPDEMVIRSRGRKKTPITWSPESESGIQKLTHFDITPPKESGNTPTRTMFGLRSSPRKRLQLTDMRDIATNTTPDKLKKTLPNAKRQRVDGKPIKVPLDVALKGLSHDQLINLIQKIAASNPQIKEELETTLPEPDLQPMENTLLYLKKNIFKSLPNSRLSSKTDSASFNKAAVHLSAFKKAVLEQGKQLLDSEQWNSLMTYMFMAWSYVKVTPVWDNAQHNATRRQCFKGLSNFGLQALKHGYWDDEQRAQLKSKLQRLLSDSEDLTACIVYLDSTMIESHD